MSTNRFHSDDAAKRVALVITELEVGGAEKCVTQLAVALDRARWLPQIYSLMARPEAGRDAFVLKLESAGIPIHFLGARSAWSVARTVWQLRKAFTRDRPHLVQTFLYHANVIGTLAARLAGRRHVLMGLRVADQNARRLAIERLAARWTAGQVAVSQRVATFYQERSFAERKLHVVPNSVDTLTYQNAMPSDLSSEGIGGERRLLLFVGRLQEQKGLDLFLSILPVVFARLPDVEFVLVGDGPQRAKLAAQAVELAQSHGFNSERIRFCGWRSDVAGLMKRANLLVLPSRYEGMPNVLLEAMAAGLPFLASRAEGVEEIVGERSEETTVPLTEIERWPIQIVRLVTDQPLRRDLIAWGQERVAAQFSIAAMTRAYERLWTNALSE